MLRGDLQQLVLRKILQAVLQAHVLRRNQAQCVIAAACTRVRQMLALADIDHNILRFRCAADDHALIDVRTGRNEQAASFLRVIQSVGNCLAGFIGNQRADRSALDVALIRREALEHRGHDALALRIGQEFALVSEQAARRDQEFQTHPAALRMHLLHLALAGTDLLHDCTDSRFRHVDHKALDRLVALAFNLLEQDTRRRNCQLIALSAHVLDQDRQMHFASARD